MLTQEDWDHLAELEEVERRKSPEKRAEELARYWEDVRHFGLYLESLPEDPQQHSLQDGEDRNLLYRLRGYHFESNPHRRNLAQTGEVK